MESFIKKTEPVVLTDSLSQIKTIKIKYTPPMPVYYENQMSPAEIGLVFIFPPHLKDEITNLFENQLKITPGINLVIQNGDLFLGVSFSIIPRTFGFPLKGLSLLKEKKFITEEFRQKISGEYTEVLIQKLNEQDEINESKSRFTVEINGRRTINKAKKPKIGEKASTTPVLPLKPVQPPKTSFFQPLSKELEPLMEESPPQTPKTSNKPT